jgi:hypothetical protein
MNTMSKPRPLSEYLAASATLVAGGQLVAAVAVGALASSRARHHALSAPRLAGLVAGAATVFAVFNWFNGTFAGAADRLAGRVDPDRSERAETPLDPRQLWRSALGWGAVVSVWALAGGGLVAAVLNGRRASTIVAIASLAGLAGLAAIAVDGAARRRGVLSAERPPDSTDPAPLRRRAWLVVALPFAVSQMFVNGAMAWVLFHDYGAVAGPSSAGGTPAVLTRHVALADALVIAVIVAVVFTTIAGTWGAVDAALERVARDDEHNQTLRPGTRLGLQGIVYIVVGGLVVARLISVVMPKQPTLPEVVAVRALFSGAMVLFVSAHAYVRGALNAWNGVGPGGVAFPPSPTRDAA